MPLVTSSDALDALVASSEGHGCIQKLIGRIQKRSRCIYSETGTIVFGN